MALATTIDDVISILDDIIADCRTRGDRLGYFPALYRQVTLTVKYRAASGYFDDAARLDGFDAAFANRYFAAYDAYRAGEPVSVSWRNTFNETRSGRTMILQDLMLAINAHINLDLGVATGERFQGPALADFHGDFNKINTVLEELIPHVMTRIGEHSPMLWLLDIVVGRDAQTVLGWAVSAARDEAWLTANVVAAQSTLPDPMIVELVDAKATLRGKLLTQPATATAVVVPIIRTFETAAVATVIDALNSIVAADGSTP